MLPPEKPRERIPTADFITATISEIEYDLIHETLWKGEKKVGPAVRFCFEIDGLKEIHKSNWMGFNYSEKANLYKKYMVSLVEGAAPFMKFDLDALKGLRVKMLWQDNPNNPKFQQIENIRPLAQKILVTSGIVSDVPTASEEVPF